MCLKTLDPSGKVGKRVIPVLAVQPETMAGCHPAQILNQVQDDNG
jgi:hypothetical protein